MNYVKWLTSMSAVLMLAFATTIFTGCDRNEEVLDVETPSGEVEVERDRDTGETEVDTD